MSIHHQLSWGGLLCAALLFLSPAGADTILELVTQSEGKTDPQTIYLAGDRLRMDVSEGLEKNSMLFDAKTNTLTMLDHQEKAYVEITEEDALKLHKGMQDMQQQMKARMQEQMKDMSAEERKAMEQMMSQLGEGMLSEKPQRRIEATEQRQSVSGFDCDIVNLYKDGQKEQQWCITSPEALGMTTSEYQTFAALMAMLDKLAGDEAGTLTQIGGLPVRTVNYEEGEQQEVTALNNVRQEGVAAELFKVPAGYTRQDPFKQN